MLHECTLKSSVWRKSCRGLGEQRRTEKGLPGRTRTHPLSPPSCLLLLHKEASWSLKFLTCHLIMTPKTTPRKDVHSPRPALTLEHAAVGPLGHRVHVGWHFVALLAPVHLHNGLGIDGKLLVWIDDHTEKARVRLWWARKGRASAAYPRPRGQHGTTRVQLGRLCTAQGHPSKGSPFIP